MIPNADHRFSGEYKDMAADLTAKFLKPAF